jgi:hypothetical protein
MRTCPECDRTLGPGDAFGHDCEAPPACDCPNCEAEESDCLKNFCAICREELGYESTYPDSCGLCLAANYQKDNLA